MLNIKNWKEEHEEKIVFYIFTNEISISMKVSDYSGPTAKEKNIKQQQNMSDTT